jgi:hypothetical protein
MELEKTEPGREAVVFAVCNRFIKAILSGDPAQIKTAETAWNALDPDKKST